MNMQVKSSVPVPPCRPACSTYCVPHAEWKTICRICLPNTPLICFIMPYTTWTKNRIWDDWIQALDLYPSNQCLKKSYFIKQTEIIGWKNWEIVLWNKLKFCSGKASFVLLLNMISTQGSGKSFSYSYSVFIGIFLILTEGYILSCS